MKTKTRPTWATNLINLTDKADMWVEQTDSTPKQTARLMLILATAAITLGATTTAAFYLAFYLIKTLPPLATAAIATITTLKLIQWTIKN